MKYLVALILIIVSGLSACDSRKPAPISTEVLDTVKSNYKHLSELL